MCSFIATNILDFDLEKANYWSRLRGPDCTVEIDYQGIRFVHNLLSINGSFAPQPFVDEANDVLCVYNGEIYNCEQIAGSQVDSDGHSILPAYEKYGYHFPRFFDGEFAVALFDFRSRNILLATDPFGTKPLWYARNRTNFGIASYKSSLLALGFNPRLIERVPPNHIQVLDLDSLTLLAQLPVCVFDVTTQDKNTYDDWIRAFELSVEKRSGNTREKIFIGLSSGYDSGAIACELLRQERRFKAYAIEARENKTLLLRRQALIPNLQYIQLRAEEYKTAQSHIKAKAEEFQYQIIRNGKVTVNEFMSDDQGAIGLSHICYLAHNEGYRIYLSGQGADEIISDYGYAGKKIYGHSSFGGLFPDDLSKHFPWHSFYGSTQISYLAKEEHVSGSYGIEGRYPFLDKALVQEFLWLTPQEKNRYYKAPLAVYLMLRDFPFQRDEKIGFSSSHNLHES